MEALLVSGRSIREFASDSAQQVFQDAARYPAFFDRHLIDQQRRVKIFYDDPNASLKAFYFQYLIICYELENEDFEFYIDKLNHFVLDPNFSFIFLEGDDQEIFNDSQFKRFFLEFQDILESNQLPTVEAAINKYPIADVVFTYFFRSLIIYAQITDNFHDYLDTRTVLGFLMHNFKIDVVSFEEKGLKFCEAEVFLYEESPQEIYMVYKEISANESSESHQNIAKNYVVESEKIQAKIEQRIQSGNAASKQDRQVNSTANKQLPASVSQSEWGVPMQSQSQQQSGKKILGPHHNQDFKNNEQILSSNLIKTEEKKRFEQNPSYNFQSTQHYKSQAMGTLTPSKSNQQRRQQTGLSHINEKKVGFQARTLRSKLDVSHEFTDSLTLAKMGEPFASHIKAMKVRSREFRQSLINRWK